MQYLDSPDTYAKVLFVDYSSAFNTIILSKLFAKIYNVGVPQSIDYVSVDLRFSTEQTAGCDNSWRRIFIGCEKNKWRHIVVTYFVNWHASRLCSVTIVYHVMKVPNTEIF